MTELTQVIEKLNSLEKGHEQILTAITGNDKLGQKGFVHRVDEVEKRVWKNTGEIETMKTIKAYSEKRIGIIVAVTTALGVGVLELCIKLIK